MTLVPDVPLTLPCSEINILGPVLFLIYDTVLESFM